MRTRSFLRLSPLLLSVLAICTAAGQSLADFEKKVTEFTLPNGLKFLVIERHDAPVVSFHTYVNAGAVDDPSGDTGLAHMFEHMAFKGTPQIGSKNWPLEKKALDHIEVIYDKLDAEKNKARGGVKPNEERLKALEAELKDAIESADSFVEPNEYDRIVESNGGVGMNAGTSEDSTQYFYSFPSNRLELWFLLESERFLHPVLREFYKERDVVREERRMRVESSPQGMLIETLLATAFEAHPYHNWAGGWPSDIESLRRTEAEAFYKKYYVPSNLIIAIAGDVNAAEARKLATKYFGRLHSAPLPPLVRTEEPPQVGEKRVKVASPAQPLLVIGYKRPDELSPDDAALDVLGEILTGGRTGLMYTEMVRDKQLSLGLQAIPSFPGGKYPSLFLLFMVPAGGHTVEDNEKAAYEIVERVKNTKIDAAALQRVKTKLRAGVIMSLASNSGLAETLTSYQASHGDWRRLFTELEDYNKVTVEDVQRVARKYLVETSRTVAYTYAPAQAAAQGGK
ncbi:MAG: pitrilysin family protein [Acidobacteriota bacterium]